MHPDENPPEDLKRRINELLWTCLPGNTTLSEAQRLYVSTIARRTVAAESLPQGIHAGPVRPPYYASASALQHAIGRLIHEAQDSERARGRADG